MIERCYCLPVEKSQIPHRAQLLPRHLFATGGLLLFPFGWALLYNQKRVGHNVSVEHERLLDQQGHPRHYLVLRAVCSVPLGSELLLPGSAESMPSVALEACGVKPPKASADPDFTHSLPYSTSVEVRYSPIHGNGVYATKSVASGEIVEFAPSVLLMKSEMGQLFADYRYSAESLRDELFRDLAA